MGHKDDVTERLIHRVRQGDELAQNRLYTLLEQRFSGFVAAYFDDPQREATALNDAYGKLLSRLGKDFVWQGQGPFYAFFKRILVGCCHDLYRDNRRERERRRQEHWAVTKILDETGEAAMEYVEHLPGHDPQKVEAEARRNEQLQAEFKDFADRHLTARDWQLWAAYRALDAVPESGTFGSHAKTAFLQRELDWSESTFYPAHTRLRQRVEPFARRWMRIERS